MLEATSAKVTGASGLSGWTQIHEFLPEEKEKIEARGKLWAVVATKRVEAGVEISIAGRELLSRLHEEYFGSLEESPFNALKKAIEKVLAEFKNSWGDVEIAACSAVGDAVYSAAGGGGRVMISRGGALATILDSRETVISASGYPQKGDTLLLATREFFEKVPAGVIKASLSKENAESAIEDFIPMVRGGENMGSMGAVVIKFSSESKFLESISEQEPEVPVKIDTQAPSGRPAGFVKRILEVVGRISKKLPERRIYVRASIEDGIVSQNKKLTFSVAIVLLIILALSILFGIRQKRINDLKKKYGGILSTATQNVDEAISLAAVSPERSRELFYDSELKLKEIEALKVQDPKVDELRKKIDEGRSAILGEYDGAGSLFLDLSLLSSGFKGDSLSFSGNTIFIADKSGNRVVSVDITTKKSKVVAGPGVLDNITDLTSYDDKTYVLSSDGIYQVGNSKTKVIEKIWSGEALIHAFAGNMYVMDKGGGAIYRYAGQSNTFSERQNWLAASTKADFSDAASWAIDGAMYVLYPNSKILKYSLGSPQNFSVTGVFPEIGTVNAVYADPDNQYLYLLDKAGKRVVVTDKKGAYKAQYRDDQTGNASTLVVSEANKQIILLIGDKLYAIEIKHL